MNRLLLAILVATPAIARADLDADRATLREAVAMAKGLAPSLEWMGMMEQLAEAQARCGDREEARKTFARVIDSVVKFGQPEATRMLFANVAKSQANSGLAEDVRRSVEQFRKAPKVPDRATPAGDARFSTDRFFSSMIVNALITLGDYPAAREFARAEHLGVGVMTDKENVAGKAWLAQSLALIDQQEAAALLLKGNAEAKKRAVATYMELANAAVKPDAADRIYSDLSAAQAKAGNIAGAKAVAERISVDGGANRTSKATALLRIARLQLESSDRVGAAETARAALKLERASATPSSRKTAHISRLSFTDLSCASILAIIAEAESLDAASKLTDERERLRFGWKPSSRSSMTVPNKRTRTWHAPYAIRPRSWPTRSKTPILGFRQWTMFS